MRGSRQRTHVTDPLLYFCVRQTFPRRRRPTVWVSHNAVFYRKMRWRRDVCYDLFNVVGTVEALLVTLSIWYDCNLFRTTNVIQAETIRPNSLTKLCINHRIGARKATFGRCSGLKLCFRAENIFRSLSKCCSRLFHTTNTIIFLSLGPSSAFETVSALMQSTF